MCANPDFWPCPRCPNATRFHTRESGQDTPGAQQPAGGPALQQKDGAAGPATNTARKESKEQRREGTTATGPPAPAPPRRKQNPSQPAPCREKQAKAWLQTSVSSLHCLHCLRCHLPASVELFHGCFPSKTQGQLPESLA